MVGEQTAVQREWSEHWIALKSVEAELRQKEEIIPMEEEKLRVLQERLHTGHIWSCVRPLFAKPHDVIMLSVLFLRMWWMCWCVCHSNFGVQCNSTSTSCDGSGPRSSMNSLQHPSPGPQFVWQLSFVSFRGGSRAMLLYGPELCYLTKWKINHQSNSKRNEGFGSISINGCNMWEQTIEILYRVFYLLVWYMIIPLSRLARARTSWRPPAFSHRASTHHTHDRTRWRWSIGTFVKPYWSKVA